MQNLASNFHFEFFHFDSTLSRSHTTRTDRMHTLSNEPGVIHQKVRAAVTRDPKKSLRKVTWEAGCSRSTVLRVLRDNLGLTPYKVALNQRLTERNHGARMSYCAWFLRQCASKIHHFWTKSGLAMRPNFFLKESQVGRTLAFGPNRNRVSCARKSGTQRSAQPGARSIQRGHNRTFLV